MQPGFQPELLRLSNGIPVVLQHSDGWVAATYWWVQVGSADERPSEAGFAHFLEHMLFKDASAKETARASTGKLAREIESLGGDINAYTSFDQTVYHVTCAAHHWERVIEVFGGMAAPQKFLKSDFEREREVILEELRKNEDSPGRQLFQKLFGLTFRKHPYGRPVIGFPKILKSARVGNLEAFYRRNYVSGKMGLVLVGPFDGNRKAEILKRLEKRFGAKVIRPKSGEAVPRVRETELRPGPSLAVKEFDVKTPSVNLSFRVPDLSHEDVPALDLLGGILGMGELSRLYQEAFYKASLVTDVSGGLYVPKDPGMLYFQAETDSQEKILPAWEKILREIKRIQTEGPTREELARVLVNSESEKLYSTQSADGQAGRLGFLQFVLGDLSHDERYLSALRSVDEEKIREVAARYFDPRRMSGVVMLPKGSPKFDLKTLEKTALEILGRPESKQSKGKTPEKSAGLPELLPLPSGMRAVFLHRPNSHAFSIHAAALGGLRSEISQPLENANVDWGASHMMSLTWTKGTAALDSRAIGAITEGSAASIDGFAGRNTVGLQMTGLARDWKKLSQLFTDVLFNPSFPPSEVEHTRRIVEDSIRGIEDHSSQLCSKLFLETLFAHHPYGKNISGSLESVKAMRAEKLAGFHSRWIRPERLVLSVSGAVPKREIEDWLKDLEAKALAVSRPRQTLPLPSLSDEPALQADRWVERSLGREQLHILVGGLGATILSPDRHAIHILSNLLGGQSGRLFIELREKKSLAYTVAPLHFEGIERGYAGTYIACAPGKKDEALRGMREVLEKLVSKGPSKSEMERAKQFYLGRRAMDLQGDSALATHFGLETLYGIPRKTEDEVAREINRLQAKDIQAACRKYWVEPHQVTSLVG